MNINEYMNTKYNISETWKAPKKLNNARVPVQKLTFGMVCHLKSRCSSWVLVYDWYVYVYKQIKNNIY